MSLAPKHVSEILTEWQEAKQREQDALMAWHDVQSPELLTAWADAKIDLLDTAEQLELDLGVSPCSTLFGPYAQSPGRQ